MRYFNRAPPPPETKTVKAVVAKALTGSFGDYSWFLSVVSKVFTISVGRFLVVVAKVLMRMMRCCVVSW